MTTTVLVTGVGGFVGGHVVEQLLTRTDWRVIGVDSFRHNGHFANLVESTDHVRDVDRLTALVHDLTTPFTPRQCDRLDGVDYVVNVASRSSVDQSIDDPVTLVRNNVDLVLTVLELCRVVRPRRLVHVSTDEVYGPGARSSVVDHRPSNPYAASKAAQVDLVNAYARTYGVPSTVVTSANMFGERQSRLAFVPKIVRAVLDGEPVDVHYHGGRPGERRYTYVRNVACWIVDALRQHEDSEHGHLEPVNVVHHVSLPGQRRITNDDLAREVARLLDRPLLHNVVDVTGVRPGYDPTYANLDVEDPSWAPPVSFDDGLSQTIHWYRDEETT